MHYLVEVAIADDLASKLNQMRTWLDHMKIHAVGFRQLAPANICRVTFENEQEAAAFAEAFSGQLLSRTAVQRYAAAETSDLRRPAVSAAVSAGASAAS